MSVSLAGLGLLSPGAALQKRREYWHTYKQRPASVERIHAKEEVRSHDRALQRHKQAKTRAANEGVPFDLTREDCAPARTTCAMCDVPFNDQNKASIDRAIPARGYVLANIGWLCLSCNGWKYRRTAADIEAMLLANKPPRRHGRMTVAEADAIHAKGRELGPRCLEYLRIAEMRWRAAIQFDGDRPDATTETEEFSGSA